MDVRNAYKKIGADYDGVLNRLMSEALVERFAGKFLEDDSFPKLKEALAAGNAKDAFLAAHTLKGICQNFGLTNLYEPTYAITEELRGGEMGRAPEMFPAVEEQYQAIVEAFGEE